MIRTLLEKRVNEILNDRFIQHEIQVVPDIENSNDSRLTHGNTGLTGEFTFLYVDMRGSSSFTDQHRLQTITKIYKAFHHCMIECIKLYKGKIRSFDGDRILAVFDGDNKIINAISCAKKMTGCRYEILNPLIDKIFSNDKFSLGIGISTGKIMVSKAGIGYDKNTRDLIWIGDAPNLGSKLSDEADAPFSIYICENTYNNMPDVAKLLNHNGSQIYPWTKDSFEFKKDQAKITIYKTGYYYNIT